MAYTEKELKKELDNKSYEFGFVTDIESEKAPNGLNEEIIKFISAKKNEPSWLLESRLKAFNVWSEMEEPDWAHVEYEKPNFQEICYYAAPKQKKKLDSLDEVDPELLKTMEKLGISIEEQKRLTGVAVDFVMDSVSVATSFKAKLAELGIIFCSFSEAVKDHPELVRKYIGSVVPPTDTIMQLLTVQFLRMGLFVIYQKGLNAQWSYLPIFESMNVELVNLKELS